VLGRQRLGIRHAGKGHVAALGQPERANDNEYVSRPQDDLQSAA
jgi:hypothetical protein